MSILIKGMKLPTAGMIGIIINNEGKAFVAAKTYDVIELPPHGDLIDRYAVIRSAFNGEQNIYCWDEIEEAIDSVPTIIEAEEAGPC